MGGFSIELLPVVIVPGLPQDGSLVTTPAELAGAPLPWFTLSEISRFFFMKDARWLRRKLQEEENQPPVTHPLFFSPLPGARMVKGDAPKRWTLGEVERMVVWMYEARTIKYRPYLIARQVVAWVARGHGVYNG
jgi:hypothetical protein